MTKEKREALRLLKKYDKLRAELRTLEPQLNKACADYGRSVGIWGYRPDHLRMDLAREEKAA